MAKKTSPKQRILSFGRGGWRPGAGRKPSKRRNKIVLHRKRPKVTRRTPVHVTLKMHREVTSLRTKARVKVIRRAFISGCQRCGFRIVDWSVQGNHLHLVCEADSITELSRGMQGFNVRVARGLNRLAGRKGAVFTERYHVRLLRTPAEVRNARAYVVNNYRRHAAQSGRQVARGWVDPFSSWAWFDGWRDLPLALRREAARERDGPAATAQPLGWLLQTGWRRRGLVSINETPAQCQR